MVCNWMDLLMRPLAGYIFITYVYMFTWARFWHGFYYMVILCSTTGPYGRPMLEVAYGETLLSLHRGCMGDDSSGRVVGVSTWCRSCWTYLGQHQCGHNTYYFLSFHTIKLYVLCFQIYIYSIKQKHWWSLTLSWPDEVQRTFLTAHCLLKIN